MCKVSRLSRKVPDYPEKFQTTRKFSRPSVKFSDHTESFQNMWKVFRPSGKCPDHLESLQTNQKVSRPSRKFPDHPETFQTIQKLSRLPETFQTITKVSRPSGNLCFWTCLLMVDFIDTRKNFPDAQKLSRWQCHHETWVFLTLLYVEGGGSTPPFR